MSERLAETDPGAALVAGLPRRQPPSDLREAILHVLVETETHAGHLDAVRELIDGKQFLVLD
ncbi:DUF664 domain-containing protein [Microbispora sp. H11081]|uniref:mycothiol transferase n=1 Tax=Microbispora sp. H11081 TaxID=2729107 RepID=UPI00289B04E4|nr:DUF664 domain-containing protein [Microbispora sp. H11081]